METYTDQQLLVRISRRDQTAFHILYDRYEGLVYSFSFRILREESASREAVQNVFLRLWHKVDLYDPEKGRFSSWLLTVTRRICLDLLRKKSRERDVPIHPDALEWHIDRAAGDNQWAVLAERDRLRRAVNQLTKVQIEVVERAYWQGYSLSQIASLLDLPVGTVKSRLHQALLALRRILDDMEKEGESCGAKM